MKNGEMWYDDRGQPIQAHGGMILRHGDVWYWYGEDKGAPNTPGKTRVDVIGISCYSSRDLVSWHREGLALDVRQAPAGSLLAPGNVCERPKVLYCEKTGRFVMWFHADTADYVYAGVGVAVADRPTGPFRLLYTKQPNRQDSRDMTLFRDRDGTAYLVHSSNWNKTMNIARLTDDFEDLDGFYISVLRDQEREAPALVLEEGMYYMVTSGCTGWDCNSALYAASPHLLGQWKLIDNPCEGPGYRDTFRGQSTCIFRAGGRLWLLLDHWRPHDLQSSGYSILPLEIRAGRMTVRWQNEWTGLPGEKTL